MTSRPDMERAVEVIAAAPSLALACHVAPDGDALGSMLALHHLALAAGKRSVASWSEPFKVAPHYAYLPGLKGATKPADFPPCPPVMVTFDCGALHRLGDLAAAAGAAREGGELIVVDHHLSNDRYGTINVVDVDAAATAVVVRELAARLGWALNRDAAICLYTGLVTDTGRFQYSNTTPKALRLAAELVEAGADVHHIFQRVYETVQFAKLKLLARALDRAQLYEGGRLVVSYLLRNDFQEVGAEEPYSEGIIDYLRQAEGADMVALIREPLSDNGPTHRISLRSSQDEMDVSAVARKAGGGGHRQAAGFSSEDSLEGIIEFIRREFVLATGSVGVADAAAGE